MRPAATQMLPADLQAVEIAAQWLRQGFLVAFPTETVYGLGASTFDANAIERIYRLKGRPSDNPLIAHVGDASLLSTVAAPLSGPLAERVDLLTSRFWPGPLTLVLPRHERVPPIAAGGLDSIAVRAPAHPVATTLLEKFGGAISAPSANRSGGVSPTDAAHVLGDFPDAPELLVLDGGPSRVGVESTVLDLTAPMPRLLRPGSVTLEQIRDAIGEVETPHLDAQGASPGTAWRHYAPATPARLVESAALADAIAGARKPVGIVSISPIAVRPPNRHWAMPPEAESYAGRLYAVLREADAAGCTELLVERPALRVGLWAAILDRLERATRG
jgi:L-threonylcarbamoyladenylate synthase